MSAVDRYLNWLDSEIGIQENYHNHKETMAWTATAFYLPAVIVLGYTAAPEVRGPSCLALAFVIGILGFVTAMFVNMQFEMRWIADDTIKGLRRARGILSAVCDFPAELVKDVPPVSESNTPQVWPLFIQTEIDKCESKRSLCKFCDAMWFGFTFRWRKIDPKMRTELASYAVLLIATMIAIGALWVRKTLACTV